MLIVYVIRIWPILFACCACVPSWLSRDRIYLQTHRQYEEFHRHLQLRFRLRLAGTRVTVKF